MICGNCKNKMHGTCVVENNNKAYSACDCQHHISQKTIVLPSQSGKAKNSE